MKRPLLWQQLKAFNPGGELHDLFMEKLQQQNNWSESFCRGAVEEYRRFLYLATISTEPVTPSKIIDEVWHLHLTFNRSYNLDLCRAILGWELYHEPAVVTAESQMAAQYCFTLALYQQEFLASPDSRFWLDQDQPKATQLDNKKTKITRNFKFLCFALGSLGLFQMAQAAEESMSSSSFVAITFIIVAVIGLVVVIVAKVSGSSAAGKKHNSDSSGSSSSDGSDGGSSCGGGGCGGGGCGS